MFVARGPMQRCITAGQTWCAILGLNQFPGASAVSGCFASRCPGLPRRAREGSGWRRRAGHCTHGRPSPGTNQGSPSTRVVRTSARVPLCSWTNGMTSLTVWGLSYTERLTPNTRTGAPVVEARPLAPLTNTRSPVSQECPKTGINRVDYTTQAGQP